MGGSTTTNSTNHADQPFSRKIALAVKSQDGDAVYYRVTPDKKIGDLLKNYCLEKNFKFDEMNFIHNGERIQTTKTLSQLGIEEGDEIDAMGHCDGGGSLTIFA